MMSILQLVDVKVRCIIDGKEYDYKNGIDAYSQLDKRYMITSISLNNDYIVFALGFEDKLESHWEEEYKKQFGEEPSFF